MNDHDKPLGDPAPAPITSAGLRDLVLDHVLANYDTFLSDNSNVTDRFIRLLDSMNTLAQKIATDSIVNRQHLSALQTYDHLILPDPEQMPLDSSRYELRYRVVEQIGDAQPHKDRLYSLDEAKEVYGDSFIENHWGLLGERCPNRITTGADRHLWFTVVRYPVASLDQQASASQSRDPSLR